MKEKKREVSPWEKLQVVDSAEGTVRLLLTPTVREGMEVIMVELTDAYS